jgi:hypothetical protein
MVLSGDDHLGIFLEPKRRAPLHPGLGLGYDHRICPLLCTTFFNIWSFMGWDRLDRTGVYSDGIHSVVSQ